MDHVTGLQRDGRIPPQRVSWPSPRRPRRKTVSGKALIRHRSFDGKAKVWSVESHACVATQGENDETLWTVKWLPKVGHTERFAVAGASRSISFYREATGADKK
jgi:WD40 repeat protein